MRKELAALNSQPKGESRFPAKTVIGAMNAVGIFGAPIEQKLNRFYLDRKKANIKSFTLVEDSWDFEAV